ncbi:hypothetical protein KS138_13285 [Staphylococcus aureus]|nr:hypothetical protein [Staphylococcus aureus]MBV2959074.1 hypothetical protein [Staphylococcus aureus]MBV2961672.1 hypothetical protein [Staphylococcus aureus]MBV2964243.1 hypothetical protein [Staphylococcus aureus]
MKKKTKDIMFIWLLLGILYILGIVSSFEFAIEKVQSTGIDTNNPIIITTFILVNIISLIMLFIQILVFSLILYFIATVTGNNLNKKESLYIMSFTFLINMLSLIPLSIVNLFFSTEYIVISNNYIYILLNPFLLLSIYALYKLLKKNSVNIKLLSIFIPIYYIIQVIIQFLNN